MKDDWISALSNTDEKGHSREKHRVCTGKEVKRQKMFDSKVATVTTAVI